MFEFAFMSEQSHKYYLCLIYDHFLVLVTRYVYVKIVTFNNKNYYLNIFFKIILLLIKKMLNVS